MPFRSDLLEHNQYLSTFFREALYLCILFMSHPHLGQIFPFGRTPCFFFPLLTSFAFFLSVYSLVPLFCFLESPGAQCRISPHTEYLYHSLPTDIPKLTIAGKNVPCKTTAADSSFCGVWRLCRNLADLLASENLSPQQGLHPASAIVLRPWFHVADRSMSSIWLMLNTWGYLHSARHGETSLDVDKAAAVKDLGIAQLCCTIWHSASTTVAPAKNIL